MPIPTSLGPDDPLSIDGAQIWSRLRLMRSNPPGHAPADPERQRRFRAALEQSQQFYSAALIAPADTKPVMLFYSSGQALKAWAAAALEDLWKPRSHGLKICVPDAPKLLSDVTVQIQPVKSDKQTSDFNTLRRLMESPPVDSAQVVSLGEVWGLLSARLGVQLVGSRPAFHSINLYPYSCGDRVVPAGHGRATSYQVSAPPHPLIAASESRAVIAEQLPKHFAAIGQCTPWPLVDSRTFGGTIDDPAYLDVDLIGCPDWLDNEFKRQLVVTIAARMHNSVEVRDLQLVWLALAALADVARYEPEFWRACLDVDQTPDSESLTTLMNYAQTYVLGMVHRALESLSPGQS